MIKVKAGWFIQKCALLCKESSFKPTAAPYMQHYSKLLFWVIGLKNPCLSFSRFLSFVESQIQTRMNLVGGRAKEGGVQHKGHCSGLFNSNAGEPKGRNVSEGLIGSDTIGKLSGPLHVLSSVKERRNAEAGTLWERRMLTRTKKGFFSLSP